MHLMEANPDLISVSSDDEARAKEEEAYFHDHIVSSIQDVDYDSRMEMIASDGALQALILEDDPPKEDPILNVLSQPPSIMLPNHMHQQNLHQQMQHQAIQQLHLQQQALQQHQMLIPLTHPSNHLHLQQQLHQQQLHQHQLHQQQLHQQQLHQQQLHQQQLHQQQLHQQQLHQQQLHQQQLQHQQQQQLRLQQLQQQRLLQQALQPPIKVVYRERRNAKRSVWTPEMDMKLKELALKDSKKNWTKIAEDIPGDVTPDQCRNRWLLNVAPVVNNLKTGPWSREEEKMLREYAALHPSKKGNCKTVNWGEAPEKLGRSGADCQHKWVSMRQVGLKRGPFTEEEDAIIIKRVQEWQGRGLGLWTSLEKELGRSSNNCNHRWKRKLKKRLLDNGVVIEQPPNKIRKDIKKEEANSSFVK